MTTRRDLRGRHIYLSAAWTVRLSPEGRKFEIRNFLGISQGAQFAVEHRLDLTPQNARVCRYLVVRSPFIFPPGIPQPAPRSHWQTFPVLTPGE
jgi:hypothetical protein